MLSVRERRVAERQERGERDQHQRPPRQAECDQVTQHRRSSPRCGDHCRHSLSTKIAPRPTTTLAGLQAVADLHAAVLLHAELDDAALEHHRLAPRPRRSPPRRRGSRASTGIAGAGSPSPVAILKVANISALAARRPDWGSPSARRSRRVARVGRRADRGDARLEHAVRQGGDAAPRSPGRRARTRMSVLRHVGLEPHGRQIGRSSRAARRSRCAHIGRGRPCARSPCRRSAR